MARKLHIVTGATSGMGLYIAKAITSFPSAHVLVGARRPDQVAKLKNLINPDQLTLVQLDLDHINSVTQFSAEVTQQLTTGTELVSIVCNAGLQLIGPKEMSGPGIERTFQVNFLSHFLLIELLSDKLTRGGSIVTIGSGTHNPGDRLATTFGFRGASFPAPAAVVAGDIATTGSETQLGMDRYATSKLCAILYAHAMAQQVSAQDIKYYSFDPGLMPGTELARGRSLVEKVGWYYILPAARFVKSGISTSKISGAALVHNCIVEPKHPSGSYVDFTGKLAPRSQLSKNDEKAIELIAHSRSLVAQHLP